MGKNIYYWKKSVLTKSPRSTSFIKVISGNDTNTAAGRAFKELVDEHEGGKTFFPRYYRTDPVEQEKLLKKVAQRKRDGQPELLPEEMDEIADDIREYLDGNEIIRNAIHELPGMEEAVNDLNKGLITKEEFKDRILANRGHNDGAGENGFWRVLFQNIMPQVVDQDQARNFVNGTIWARGSSGLKKSPNAHFFYSGVRTKAGWFHALGDRLSQGTKGGMLKIFQEIASKPGYFLKGADNIALKNMKMAGKDGLGFLSDMLFTNPKDTIEQFQALGAHVKKLPKVKFKEKGILKGLAKSAEERLVLQKKFLDKHITKTFNEEKQLVKMVFEFKDKRGQKVVIKLDGNSNQHDAMTSLNLVMEAEERAHGDPIKGFPPRTPSNYPYLLAPSFGLAAYAGVCNIEVGGGPSTRWGRRHQQSTD